ncbi:hypothetical protein JHK82_042453 [Glycine max]|nr:hypothetical protein JHK85_043116 [Glycine max]KAG5105483.1 hypothetical protein JHK82_042453 [Glycine max]KAG5116600.1 hypothetical protein JHK84_042713 [Glycine max]
MVKNEMKIVGFMIMIMIVFNFAQAYHNLSFVQIDKNNMSSILKCPYKYDLECLPALATGLGYTICVTACIRNKCIKKSTDDVVHDCIASCCLTKSNDINIDARGLAPYVVDSCMQECQKKS